MNGLEYVLVRFVSIFLEIVLLAMGARAILGWFIQEGESPILNFLYVVTEPLVVPVRALCGVFGWFEGVPIDMPYLITMVTMSIVNMLLTGWGG